MNTHLAFVKPAIRLQLEAGTKTCEVRLSKNLHPARHTQVGDQLLFKETGGDVFMIAAVSHVHLFTDLFPTDIIALAQRFEPCAGKTNYWETRWNCRYGVILGLDNLRPTELSDEQTPKSVMLGWVQNFMSDQPPVQPCLFEL